MGARNDRKRSRSEVDTVPSSIEDRENGAKPKKARTEDRRSLFVHSLPTDATTETLTDFFSQHFPVKHAVVVVDQTTKESKGFGFVTLADAEDATAAKTALDKKEWGGKRIRIDIAEPRQRNTPGERQPIPGKPDKNEFVKLPKLIIRNLPWSIKTSEQLSNLFQSFGKVKFADLPQNKGKLKGFGFVTLRGKANAEKALEAINGKEVDGRTLAVDWAVDKGIWDMQQSPEEKAAVQDTDESDAESEDDADSEDGGAKTKQEGTRDEGLDADLENFLKNHMQNIEDEDDEDEDDEEEKQIQAPKRLMTDNSSTVFIRNLPFTTTDEQLKTFFESFGKIRYARVVMDKASDKPAGTGFVCFVDGAEAKACIKGAPRQQLQTAAAKHSILQDESADPQGKYTLDGRLLSVAQAVNKEQASSLAENSNAQRREKDKRRLFLLAEGAVNRGSALYNLLTPTEVQMRQASAAQRKKLVQKNPSLHISLTRLALRNIPRNIGSKELKELARKGIVGFATEVREGRREPLSKEENSRDTKEDKERDAQRKAKGKGLVRQAKVVFESSQGSKVPEQTGAGKSRGYGFIEYTTHHWALMGLRYLNGHQLEGDNGKKQRLVVEFAIENAQVVQRRKEAEAKSGQPQKPKDQEKDKPEASEGRNGAKKGGSQKPGKGKRAPSIAKGKRAPIIAKGQKSADKGGAEGGEGKGAGDAKDTMQQTLIQRKRVMRKKKATARSKG